MIAVSIIVAVYNTAKYLNRCLNSIKNQTMKNIEVIIVDDGSTDDSSQIYSSYLNLPNFRLLKKKNGGLTSARYAGYNISTGDYIVFIDSDDFIEPSYCQELYNSCIQNKSELSICTYNTIDIKHNRHPHYLCYKENIIQQDEIENKYFLAMLSYDHKSAYNIQSFLWMRMMRRDKITKNCFINENKVFSEDLVFNINYINNISKISIVNKTLYNYCYNDNSLTNRYRNNALEMRLNLYNYCKYYCEQYKIKNYYNRINLHLLSAILYVIHNATKLQYNLFNTEIQKIKNEKNIKLLLNNISINQFLLLQINFKILVVLLKMFPTKIIYKFYKWRQSRK